MICSTLRLLLDSLPYGRMFLIIGVRHVPEDFLRRGSRKSTPASVLHRLRLRDEIISQQVEHLRHSRDVAIPVFTSARTADH
jgi:hypothetical protein